ncbi:hypothetical protein C6I21_01310 [Alkalicoccus urumqiensis]|uniref:Uncharacterized protein n=1 Tax=Alkalicoccus urumqiensis TaxID=1548213 RepID=A0A2P6MLU3_ALKUR|nr:hypothetical protein C6I21_01310 [Alkalicoccus urumqiensis]
MLVRGRLFLVQCFSNAIKPTLPGTVIYENLQEKEYENLYSVLPAERNPHARLLTAAKKRY